MNGSSGMNFPFSQQNGGYHNSYTPTGGPMNQSFSASNAYWTSQPSSGPQATTFSLGGLLGAHRADQFNPHDYGSPFDWMSSTPNRSRSVRIGLGVAIGTTVSSRPQILSVVHWRHGLHRVRHMEAILRSVLTLAFNNIAK